MPSNFPTATTEASGQVLRISHEYAEACADCEELRTSDVYPHARWRAAWERRAALQSEWMRTAKRLTERPTDPPEWIGR